MALKIDPIHARHHDHAQRRDRRGHAAGRPQSLRRERHVRIPLQSVLKGTIPFFIGDLIVLLLVIFFPALATWLPDLLVKSVF